MRKLFEDDAKRFEKFSLNLNNILVDFSKNIISEETINLLLQLANETELKINIDAFFNGEIINETEHRAVMHTALRRLNDDPVYINKVNVIPQVNDAKQKIKDFAEECCFRISLK